jgi:hypothetical protein
MVPKKEQDLCSLMLEYYQVKCGSPSSGGSSSDAAPPELLTRLLTPFTSFGSVLCLPIARWHATSNGEEHNLVGGLGRTSVWNLGQLRAIWCELNTAVVASRYGARVVVVGWWWGRLMLQTSTSCGSSLPIGYLLRHKDTMLQQTKIFRKES